jgi:hypothetical protein
MHNAVFEKRQEKTGVWFIKEERYVEWKISSKSFLWLYGSGLSSIAFSFTSNTDFFQIAGCGKTFLS